MDRQEEFRFSYDCAKRGDWNPMLDLAERRKASAPHVAAAGAQSAVGQEGRGMVREGGAERRRRGERCSYRAARPSDSSPLIATARPSAQGLILSAVVPLALTLRFPGLIFLALRGAVFVPLAVFSAMPASARHIALNYLWRQVVRMYRRR